MTLQVPFEELAAAAKRFSIKELYLAFSESHGVVTGYSPASTILVTAKTDRPEAEIRSALANSGCEIFLGNWGEHPLGFEDNDGSMFVAAVSYQSGEHTPGVWIDAYREEPTHVQVLEALYAEFRQTGEVAEISIEDFIRGANPNVVISSRSQLKGYIDAKESPAPCPDPEQPAKKDVDPDLPIGLS